MRKVAIPILFTFVIAIPLIMFFENTDLTPELASEQGQNVDDMLRVLYILASIVFGGVVSFLLYSVVAFRRRPGDLSDAEPIHGHTGLEIAWTLVPLIVVLGLGAAGADALLDIYGDSDDQDLVVNVTGFQWAWSFEYPDYDFSSGELVLPVGRQTLFNIRSRDVIHSFFIPEFRVKMDAIPGITNELRVTPTQVGQYRSYCAELCGTSHAYMIAPVRVVEEADFEAWAQDQREIAQALEGQAALGRQVYEESGCLGCHSTDGTPKSGPTFRGLFGSERTFSDGSSEVAVEAYLRHSILNPADQIVEGFDNLMPANYEEQLDDAQIEALIEFIRSLE
jgi:cytochrome c oxidase subunit 2